MTFYGPVIVVGSSLIVFHRWFTEKLLTNGDWSFHFSDSMSEWFRLPMVWSQAGLGAVNLTSSTWPFYFAGGVFGQLHIYSGISDKFVFMLPIAIFAPLSSYLLARQLKLRPWASIAAAIVYSFNTYALLLSTTQLTLLAGYAFAPLALMFFIKAIGNLKFQTAVLCGIVSAIVSIYEFRVFYVLAFIYLSYLVWDILFLSKGPLVRRAVSRALIAAIPIAIVVLLNFYWLFTLTKMGSVSDNALFNRGLFGGAFLNAQNALAFFHPFWTGGVPADFRVQPIPLLGWIIPIVAVVGAWIARRRPQIIFFTLLAVMATLLIKQEAYPFPLLYKWLYDNVPGFNAFREATKFFLLIGLAYSVLIPITLERIWEQRRTAHKMTAAIIASVIIVAPFLLNTVPLINGAVGSLYVSRNIPEEYIKLKEQLLDENEFFRTIYVPHDSKWGFYSGNHPRVGLIDAIGSAFTNYPSIGGNSAIPAAQQIKSALETPILSMALSAASVKYIVLPTRDQANDNDLYRYYGADKNFYSNVVASVPWLKEAMNTGDMKVYENTNSKPYIYGFTGLTSLDDIKNLNETYRFYTSQVAKDFNFVIDPMGSVKSANKVKDIFQGVTANEIFQGKIELSIGNAPNASLYSSINNTKFSYSVTNQTASFMAQSSGNLELPVVQDSRVSKSRVVAKYSLEAGKNYFIDVDGRVGKLSTTDSHSIGSVKKNLNIITVSPQNLVSNPSFESGLWSSKVEDCNNYDLAPSISMNRAEGEATDGLYLLALTSQRHNACTQSPAIPVIARSRLFLSFDYRTKFTNQAAYRITFNDASRTVIEDQIFVPDQGWHTLNLPLNVPAGATEARIALIGIPSDKSDATGLNMYDNIALSNIAEDKSVTSRSSDYKTEAVNPDIKTAVYADKDISKENLISNPSLEEGTWQAKVGDCNAHDKNPEISMKLSAKEKSEGEQSLELAASRHIACTGPQPVKVKENSTYLLSFDYQSPNAAEAGYFVGFNDPDRSGGSNRLLVKDKKWHTFTKIIKAPLGADSLSLAVYAYSGERRNVINRYDNFHLIEVPDIQDQYYLVSNPSQKLQIPDKVDFTLVNPTKKLVHIKSAKTPFYLSMSENYHPKWRLELNNAQVKGAASWIPWAKPNAIAATDHFKLNDFLNGWYVDPAKLCAGGLQGCVKHADGSYDLELIAEFTPQRWFYVGGIISATTLLACLTYLGFVWRKRRRNRAPKTTRITRTEGDLHTPGAPEATPRPKPAAPSTKTVDLSQTEATPAPRRRTPIDPLTAAKRDVKRPPRRRL